MKQKQRIKNKQEALIGTHPASPSQFAMWLTCNDVQPTKTKIHRSLTQSENVNNPKIIEWLGKRIFEHHHSESRIQKLKENFVKLGYRKYAEQHRKLPKADKTKKGNGTEIILSEYLTNSLGRNLIQSFKLQYNPNPDQAMKGDDTLLIDVIETQESKKIKIYLGEAKFRQVPSPSVVETISKSLAKDKLPLSYSFVIEELEKNEKTKDIADLLDSFIINDIKGNGDLIYAGLLLSNQNTFDMVEKHLNSDNPSFVFISIGINQPEELINGAFEEAERLFNNPNQI
jgi:hypothetical protein